MTTKEQAIKGLRDAITIATAMGYTPEQLAPLQSLLDRLDPPKPTYPDGTFAIVTASAPTCTRSYYARRESGRWLQADGRLICDEYEVANVEPLRVLGDDKIAVPVVTKASLQLLHDADHLDRTFGYGNVSSAVLRAYSEAIEAAESGDRS